MGTYPKYGFQYLSCLVKKDTGERTAFRSLNTLIILFSRIPAHSVRSGALWAVIRPTRPSQAVFFGNAISNVLGRALALPNIHYPAPNPSCRGRPPDGPPVPVSSGGGLAVSYGCRESSCSIHSFTSVSVYSSAPTRQTTRAMPALMMSRRHMEQGVVSGLYSPVSESRPTR